MPNSTRPSSIPEAAHSTPRPPESERRVFVSTPVRTVRDNGTRPGRQDCRIVWAGRSHAIAFVPATADLDRGNETAALIAEALTAYLIERPGRTPKGWTPEVAA